MHAMTQLSSLSQLRQFCFDALVVDEDPEQVALFDQQVLRCVFRNTIFSVCRGAGAQAC
jgi:hypothetical protein